MRIWIGSFGSFPHSLSSTRKDDDDDADDDDDGGGGGDDDDDSLEVWSNVRVGGNMFKRHLNLPGNTQRLAV